GADPDKLMESQSTPFSLSLAPGSAANKLNLVASLHLRHTPQNQDRTGWNAVVAENVVQVGDWATVAMIWDGDSLLLLVDGRAVARRVFRNAEIIDLGKVNATHFWVGTWVDGRRNRYSGKIAGIRVWNTIPDKYIEALGRAEESGLGAIDSRHEDFGGDAGSLGKALAAEQFYNGGRWRRYEKGTIAWKQDNGARVIAAPMHTIFNSDRGYRSLGYPIADEAVKGGVRAMYFEMGAIYWSQATGAGAVWGPAYLRYLTLTNVLGLPQAGMPFGTQANPDLTTKFQRGRIYYARHTGAFEVHGSILDLYTSLQGPSGFLGMPISDETEVHDATGRQIGVASVFEGGTIYHSSRTGANEVHGEILKTYQRLGGPAGSLGFPITGERGAQNGVRYSAFENGVIVWRGGWESAKAVCEYEVYVEQVLGGKIDDGPWDSSGEFFARVTLEANGQCLVNRERHPRSGSSGACLKIEKGWKVPIRHDTQIYLKVDVWDEDGLSGDEYHGRIEVRYDINTLWGTLSNSPAIDGEVGVWNQQPMTTKGASSPKFGSIRFNYTIRTEAEKVDHELFRNQAWWSFSNFSTPCLGKSLYPETFRDVDVITDTVEAILNPFDELYYELAFKEAAKSGNCFGMSTVGFRALRGHGSFPEHIYRFPQAAVERHINVKQASQYGADMLHWMVRNLFNGNLIQPVDVFNEARREIDRCGACIISMMNMANGTGHAVLAYKYDLGGDNNRLGCLYVADPNRPWAAGDQDPVTKKVRHPSFIEVFKNNSFRATSITTKKNPNGFASNPVDFTLVELPSTLMMAIPYRVVSGVPRTPFWEVVATLLAIGVFAVLLGDADAEQVSVGNDELISGSGNNRRYKRNHPLQAMSFMDSDDSPLILAGQNRIADLLEIDMKGSKQGRYRQAVLLGPAGYKLDNPIAANARDTLRVEDADSAFPLLSLEVDGVTKSGALEYFVARDPSNRPARRFSLDLQQAKGDIARVGIDPRGGALMLSPGGAPAPVNIAVAINDGGQLRTGTLRGVTPTSGGEAVRIVPADWANPRGDFAVERLSSLSGGVLERKIMRGS
ncbi:MAG: hypothetical protein KC457_09740, partial [Myxococcales bacterium]|nr:hypothetical protein [Myxococcales bacterium]